MPLRRLFNPDEYGPVLAKLIKEERINPLDQGAPNQAVYNQLAELNLESAFPGQDLRDEEAAKAALAGIWLYHNFLDESHQISQGVLTTEGSFWHAIMHRRESDYWNSKYWFRMVGNHPVYPKLSKYVSELVANEPLQGSSVFLRQQIRWNPFDFVDLCEEYIKRHKQRDMVICMIQLREWQLLFDHCYRKAVGAL